LVDLIKEFNRLFVNRTDAYALQNADGSYGKVVTPLHDGVLEKHLDGSLTVGVYQIKPKKNTVKWIVWDIDDRKDALSIANAIVKELKNDKKSGYIEASGSPDSYHVWLFCEPADAKDAYAYGRQIVERLGIEDVEVFPKQERVEEGGFGNLMKLPLGIHRRVGQRSRFIDDVNFELITPCTIPSAPTKEVAMPTVKEVKGFDDILGALRPCFQKAYAEKWELEGAEGDYFRLAACSELIANKATDEQIHQYFRYLEDYQEEITQKKIDYNRKRGYKPHTCTKIKKNAASLVGGLCEECKVGKEKKPKEKEPKKEIIESSFLEFDGKIAEQVWDNGIAKFAIWDGKNVSYEDEIKIGELTYVPINDDALVEGAVLLPSAAEEYEELDVLVRELTEHIHKYVDVSEKFEKFATWYILLTWIYDKLNTLTYLRALGDTGTGKSRFLDVVGGLCYKACVVSGSITPAPIYRMIRKWRGTIILDEADFRDSSEKHEVITILNCGFERNRPVIRCEKDHPDKLQFLPTYCPKIFASRRTFKDVALESRCLTEVMKQSERDDIPYLLPKKFYEEQKILRNKLLMFRFKNRDKINPEMAQDIDLGDVESRLKQAMASFAVLFGNVPALVTEFREFLEDYNKELIEERGRTFEGMVVSSIFKLLDDGNENITAKDVVNVLVSDYNLDKVTPQRIGKVFKSLGLKTELKRVDGISQRPLVLEDDILNVLKKRYGICNDVTSVTSVTGTELKGFFSNNTHNNNTHSLVGEHVANVTNVTSLQPEIPQETIVKRYREIYDGIKNIDRQRHMDFLMMTKRVVKEFGIDEERAKTILKNLIKQGEFPIIIPEDKPKTKEES